MFAAFCMIATAAMLFYIVRYRVHFHVTYTPAAPAKRRPRQVAAKGPVLAAPPAMATSDAETIKTITDALVGLGASRKVARVAAVRAATPAAGQGVTFDEQLRRAIQYAQEAA